MSLLTIIAMISLLIGWGLFKYWQAKQAIKRVLKANADLEQENRQQRLEISQKIKEIKHAQIRQKNHNYVQRGSASAVDQQLQQHGWFRDDDSSYGLSGIQPDLSESERHGGDETSDTGSQSDL